MKPSPISQTPWAFFWLDKNIFSMHVHLALVPSCTSLSSMNHSCYADFLPRNRHAHEPHLRNHSLHKDGINVPHFSEPCTSHENAPQQMRMLSAPLFDAHLTRKEQQASPTMCKSADIIDTQLFLLPYLSLENALREWETLSTKCTKEWTN